MALFVFLDESGEFVFSPQAGSYLVFVGVVTPNPLLFNQELHQTKYELMKQGHILERFHAAEDKQSVRDRVFEILSSSKEYSIPFDCRAQEPGQPCALQIWGVLGRLSHAASILGRQRKCKGTASGC